MIIGTLDENNAFLIAFYANLFPDHDTSEGAFNWLWTRTQAAGVTDNAALLLSLLTDLLPDTAEGDLLERWGDMLGVPIKGATPARKSAALRVVGTPTTTVPDLSALVHEPSGLLFQIVGSSVIPAAGYIDVDVVAIDVGAATRLSAQQVLTFAVPVAGLEDSAELQIDLDEDGTDRESVGAFRSRILNRMRNPPLQGAPNDYETWARQIVGISAAYAYPIRAGLGSLDLAALHAGSGTARVLLESERAALEAYINTVRGVGATFRVLTVIPVEYDVEYAVIPNGELATAFDWTGTASVLTWTSGTRTLRFSAARPSSMKAGDRISVATTGASGVEYVIESLSSTDSVILEAVPLVAPVAADIVYPGGPVVQPCRLAILALIDGLGTANPDDHRYGSWEGSLRPGAINRVASMVPGVLDGTVIVPAATVSPADPVYPDDATIELVIPGRILVRPQ